ncbi:MAG: division/cell wall cluster transcriptional repressor MraZ [Lachnospiraceae bacterium]|nr:division/cell wall cluster transcriptional repressor MraZ [Lachnospiraceae bacterium]
MDEIGFSGQFEATLDAKGRMIVPASFRDSFKGEAQITIGPDGCVYMYRKEDFERFAANLDAVPDLADPILRAAKRFMFSKSMPVDIDKQGRMLFPKKAREFAHIERDIILVGMHSKVEIWDAETYNKREEELANMDISEMFAKLSSLSSVNSQ